MMKILIVAFWLASLPALAVEQRVSCPLEVRDGAVMASVERGTPGALGLTAGGIMRGHPNGGGVRRPDLITQKNGVRTTLFVFNEGDEKWLWCAYGDQVQVSRRMDDAATHCTLTARARPKAGYASMYAACANPTSSIHRQQPSAPNPAAPGK